MHTSIKSIYITGSPARSHGDNVIPSVTTLDTNPGTPAIKRAQWFQELLDNNAPGDLSVYTLSHTPSSPLATLMLYINGILQRVNIDYTVNHRTITFSLNVFAGANINAIYTYQD